MKYAGAANTAAGITHGLARSAGGEQLVVFSVEEAARAAADKPSTHRFAIALRMTAFSVGVGSICPNEYQPIEFGANITGSTDGVRIGQCQLTAK